MRKWLGHTKAIAMRHYVDVTDTMYDLGAQWLPAELESEDGELGSQAGGSEGCATSGAAGRSGITQEQAIRNASYGQISIYNKSCAVVRVVQMPRTERTGFEPARGGTPLRI